MKVENFDDSHSIFRVFSFFLFVFFLFQQKKNQTTNTYSTNGEKKLKTNKAEWIFSKHWVAIISIILIIGAAGVAVPLALRVASG